MSGFNHLVDSSAFNLFYQNAQEGAEAMSYFDPFLLGMKGIWEYNTGIDPITQAPVSRTQSELDLGFSLLPVAGAAEKMTSGLIASRFGLFASLSSRLEKLAEFELAGVESSLSGEAVNHINGLRLQKQLAQEEGML